MEYGDPASLWIGRARARGHEIVSHKDPYSQIRCSKARSCPRHFACPCTCHRRIPSKEAPGRRTAKRFSSSPALDLCLFQSPSRNHQLLPHPDQIRSQSVCIFQSAHAYAVVLCNPEQRIPLLHRVAAAAGGRRRCIRRLGSRRRAVRGVLRLLRWRVLLILRRLRWLISLILLCPRARIWIVAPICRILRILTRSRPLGGFAGSHRQRKHRRHGRH